MSTSKDNKNWSSKAPSFGSTLSLIHRMYDLGMRLRSQGLLHSLSPFQSGRTGTEHWWLSGDQTGPARLRSGRMIPLARQSPRGYFNKGWRWESLNRLLVVRAPITNIAVWNVQFNRCSLHIEGGISLIVITCIGVVAVGVGVHVCVACVRRRTLTYILSTYGLNPGLHYPASFPVYITQPHSQATLPSLIPSLHYQASFPGYTTQPRSQFTLSAVLPSYP